MEPFTYKGGNLHIENVALSDIAAQIGTPVYCYSATQIESNFTRFRKAFRDALPKHDVTICFACKANSNLAVLKTLQQLGAGADIVSGGELKRALQSGIPANKIVFSGVGKSAEELKAALQSGILQINVESEAELHLLSKTAQEIGKEAHIAFRVNPNVDAGTHAKITTGKKENKFGIDIDYAAKLYRKANSLPNIEVTGIAVHIGSQLTNLAPFRAAFERIAELAREMQEDDNIKLKVFDLGGGLGITYKDEIPPDLDEYAQIIMETIGQFDAKIILEPGRSIVGNAGVLLSRVLYTKEGTDKKFVIIDAAMNDLLRPTLYDAYHPILPCTEKDGKKQLCDVVGPVCETGDTFLKNEELPELKEGELVSILASGAYGAVMGSTYNTRPLAAEVMVKDNKFDVIRRAQTVDDILAREKLPDWLK